MIPPRKKLDLAPAAIGVLGATVNNGQGITAVVGYHFVPLNVELGASATGQYLYTTLKAPVGCLESVTAQYRSPGDITRRGHGFFDTCTGTWKTFLELTADAQAKYLNLGYLTSQVYQTGPNTWWGIVYNWQAATWELWATSAESTLAGWSRFEPIYLETTGCPSIPNVWATELKVWTPASGWTYLAPPNGTAFGPTADAACVRSYYRQYWAQWPALWSWAGYFTTPTWLMPFVGGQAREVTTMPGDGSHSTQPNLYAYDFAGTLGSDFVATRAGTVTFVKQDSPDSGCCLNDENKILVLHSDGKYSLYAHLKQNSSYVTVNQTVKAGQKLAQVGNSGLSTGPHLHFMVNTGLNTSSVSITFDDIVPHYGTPYPVSDNWPQP